MRIIGLAGGIGSGKSTVADFLKEFGAVTIDLDKTGHEALKQADVRDRLIGEFGNAILNADGDIDREILGNIVFKKPGALEKLNAIVHPAIDAVVAEKTSKCRQQGVKILVVEAAAMLEAKRDWQVDEIWVTITIEETVIERVKNRPGLTGEAIKARIRSQMSNEERVKLADVVIENDGTLEELEEKVTLEIRRLRERI